VVLKIYKYVDIIYKNLKMLNCVYAVRPSIGLSHLEKLLEIKFYEGVLVSLWLSPLPPLLDK
jgi:hypothetical protein